MGNYLEATEARELTKLPEHRVNSKQLGLMVDASNVLTSNYLKTIGVKEVDSKSISLVKMVCVELVLYLSKDKTLSSQAFDDVQEHLNNDALKIILYKLKALTPNTGDDDDTPSGRRIRAVAL